VLAAACAPPDEPAALALTLPADARIHLEPDSVREYLVVPGVVYRYLWSARGPWAVHLVQAEIEGRCDLGFTVLRPEARRAGRGGRETVSGMVRGSTDRVLAALNADFFTPEGTALGVEIVDGQVVSATGRPTFAWRPGEEPWMGTALVGPSDIGVGWSVDLRSGDGRTVAVGGDPDLIDGGARVGDLTVSARPSFAAARHPRSAVGYDVDGGVVWLVAVDGRQPPHSVGMSLPELAELFEVLGVEEALNLDGGGSTALVVGDGPVNRPSDAAGERPVVNALALVQDAGECRGGRVTR
jgi:exopolysaccharide biosynthesis protein